MRDSKLYNVLGVPATATADDIKKAYRKLARELHPDRRPDDKAAEDRLKEVNSAYEVLKDPDRRALYDEFGEASLRQGFNADQARAYARGGGFAGFDGGFGSFGGGGGGWQFDLSDLLGGAFGGGRRRGPSSGPLKGADMTADLEIDFLQAARGDQPEITLRRPAVCGRCSGQDPRCPACGGRGIVEEPARLKVRVPVGVRDGQTIRLVGQGGPGHRGGPAGDLLITLHVRPHSVFTQDGDDLKVDVPITLSEAMFGAQVEVPTLSGAVKVKVPPGSQSGRVMRLKGKGVRPGVRSPGDLYVTLLVQVPVLPADAPEALREAARTLEAAYGGDIRAGLKVPAEEPVS